MPNEYERWLYEQRHAEALARGISTPTFKGDVIAPAVQGHILSQSSTECCMRMYGKGWRVLMSENVAPDALFWLLCHEVEHVVRGDTVRGRDPDCRRCGQC